MDAKEKPKKKLFKHKTLIWAFSILGFSVLILYVLDQYIIPERVGVYFTREPEKNDKGLKKVQAETPVIDDEAILKNKEESESKKQATAIDEDSSLQPKLPKFKTIPEIEKVLGVSYPESVISDWNYNIEKGKGKKTAKSIFGKDEIDDWNTDMLGDRNAQRLKKGLNEFIKSDEDNKKESSKKENSADEIKDTPVNTDAQTNDLSSDEETVKTTPAKSAKKGGEEKTIPQKPPRERLDPYSYKVVRFMPGLGDSGFFMDYNDVDFKDVPAGKPDFKETTISRPEVFKKQFLPLGNGGSIVYEITDGELNDGDGPDFVVYSDSAFAKGIKTAKVEVAETDNPSSYVEFSCDSVNPPFKGCAGVHKVDIAKGEDIILIGGDYFDLSKIGVKKARFIRITDTGDNKNSASLPDTDGFDIDSIALVHAYKPQK